MFRLDRFLTLGLFRPLLYLKLIKQSPGIPILMYHSISDDLQPDVHPYYQTSTSPNTFRKHMAFIKENRYSVLPLKEAVGLLRRGHGLDRKVVVLTFDDGFRDFYTEAFPILQTHGYPSTVFLATAFVDNQYSKFKGKSCLSWDQVRELHGHGVAFGSHTLTHPKLIAANRNAIQTELEISKQMIELELSEHVESFSYPYAFPEHDPSFTTFLADCLKRYDYRNGVTTILGTATHKDNPFFLRRIPVNTHDDIRMFQAKLSGGYDWLHPLQCAHKKIARTLSNNMCLTLF